MNISTQSVLIVTDDIEVWKGIGSSLIHARQCKDARIKLLEHSVDCIIFDSITSGDRDQLLSFIDGLRAHPSFSGLTVFVSLDLINNFGSDVQNALKTKNITIISGADYFRTPEQHSKSVSSEFDLLFSEVKERTAKSLARLKIEQKKGALSLEGALEGDREKVINRYMSILKEELR